MDASGQMSGMPEISTVYNLIRSLYSTEPSSNDSSSATKEYASKWLESLQHSIFAWKIADELLINKCDLASCYFAAQTLRTKIQQSFHELPEDSYGSLKDSIINHLKNIPETVVQTQLCLAVTYLAILVPNWENPIEELASKVSNNTSVMVEILICLAEELEGNRMTIKIDCRRREWFNNYLNQISAHVMQLLNKTLEEAHVIQHQNPQLAEKLIIKVYRCLGAWLCIINRSDDVNLIEPILISIFESLKNPECPNLIHDMATDTVCSASILCEDYVKYQQLAHYILTNVYLLEAPFHHSVAVEDTGKTENYTRIFTELAESVVEPLIINDADGSRLLNLILNCVGHYDNDVAEITFHFWYRFSELIFKRQLTTFNHVCIRLLMSLTRHCQLEIDTEGLLDTRSDMFDFRCRVKDLVKEVIATVGAKTYIKEILKILKEPNLSWDIIEANLFIISCIIGDRDVYDDNAMITLLVNYILNVSGPNLPHIQICATNCTILGELSEWLKTNTVNLDAIFNYLLTMIGNPQKNEGLSSIAASALQSIIELCASKHLIGNTNLVSILIQICCQIDFIKNEDAANNLLQCCSALISTAPQNQDQLIVQLISPHLAKLQEICNGKSGVNISIYFDRIASIFRKLKLNESSFQSTLLIPLVNDQLWPLASHAMTQHASTNPQLIERCCRCLRFVIRCTKPSWLLQPIVNHIVGLYQQFPKHSSFLYLGSILVDEFANEHDTNIVTGLIQMLNAFSFTTFQLLMNSQLRHHPDTIDDFFRLCTRLLQKCPESFLSNTMLDNILNLTIASIQLDHREANSSVVKFVTELIDIRYSKDAIDKLLRDKIGQRLIDAIVNATLFHLPTYYVPDMADIMWLMIMWDRSSVSEWLGVSLKAVPSQNNMSIMSATPEQLEDFYRDVVKAGNPKIVASALRYLTRLYR